MIFFFFFVKGIVWVWNSCGCKILQKFCKNSQWFILFEKFLKVYTDHYIFTDQLRCIICRWRNTYHWMTDVYKDSGTKFGVLKRFLSVVIWNCSSNSMSFKRNETEIYLICILKYRHSTFMILEGENINKTN